MPPVDCQRWVERRQRYRPSGERINPAEYTVAAIEKHAEPRAFVSTHHYLGDSWPSVSFATGLYRGRRLVGVCTFGIPAQARVFSALVPGHEALELSRLVLLDEVPGDGESWFVARAMALARREHKITAIVSYSDPLTRTTVEGLPVCPGHVGVVYQALGAEYKGTGKPRTIWLDRNGRTISDRALSKIRNQEKGCVNEEARLRALGAERRESGEEPRVWLARVMPMIARQVKHPGCHRYVWEWSDDRRVAPVRPLRAYPRKFGGTEARAVVEDRTLALFR